MENSSHMNVNEEVSNKGYNMIYAIKNKITGQTLMTFESYDEAFNSFAHNALSDAEYYIEGEDNPYLLKDDELGYFLIDDDDIFEGLL